MRCIGPHALHMLQVNCEPKGNITVQIAAAEFQNATAGTAVALAFLNVVGPATAIAGVSVLPGAILS